MTAKWIPVVSLSLFALVVSAQQPAVTTVTHYQAKPLPGVKLPSGPMMAMPSIAPLFIQGADISSSLMLVNNAAISAGATITIRSLDGHQIATQHIVMEPSTQREVSLTELLSSAAEYASAGNISVLQDDGLQGVAINAQLLLTDNRNSTPSYLDEELAMPSMEGSSMLRGVADEAQGSPLLAISNSADKQQTVEIRCINEKSRSMVAQVVVPAHGTSLNAACSGGEIDNVDSYVRSLSDREHADMQEVESAQGTQQSDHANVLGIEIAGDGSVGTLAAFALAPHFKRSEVIFSAVPFGDPRLLRSSTTVYAGVPFGMQTELPDGLYVSSYYPSKFL